MSDERRDGTISVSQLKRINLSKGRPMMEGVEKLRLEQQEPMLQFFQYAHLPPELQATSTPFCDLAWQIVATKPRNPERTVCLRKLLEAKDAAVRCSLYKAPPA